MNFLFIIRQLFAGIYFFKMGTINLEMKPFENNVILLIGVVGCTFCGAPGHRITDCPRLEAVQSKQVHNNSRKDYLASGAADW